MYIADTWNHRIRKVTIATGIITTFSGTGSSSYSGDNGDATSAALYNPGGVAVDTAGNVYIADTYNQRIRKAAVSSGIIATIAGSGSTGYSGDGGAATSASFNSPYAVALDTSGNFYIADRNNNRIRKVTVLPSSTSTRVPTMTPSTSAPTVTPRYLPLFSLTTSLNYSTNCLNYLA